MATIEEPTMAPPARSLHRKLAQIMYEADRIPKNGTAPQAMGGYKFVQVGDAADYIRKALAEKVITMMPVGVQVTGQVDRPTKSGGTMTTVDLVTTWRLTDGESGESIEIQSFGAGADGGDKYSGKASTSAMKYALLTGFLLSTGEDTEQTDTSGVRHPSTVPPQPATATQPPARPHEDATSSPDAAQDGEKADIEEMMGRVRRRGIIKKGSSDDYKLTSKVGPEGHSFGFRLEIDGEKNIPQCAVAGPLGEAVYLATSEHPETLIGKVATVAGLLYNVKRKGVPNSWYRLHVDLIETDEWILPAKIEDKPVEAPTAPLFDDVA